MLHGRARVSFCCYAVREDLKKIQCLSSLISLQNIVLIVHLLQVVLSTDRKMISFTVSPPFLLYFFFFISLSLLKAGLPTFFDILSWLMSLWKIRVCEMSVLNKTRKSRQIV